MTGLDALAQEIGAIGFACTGCGDCCRGVGEDGSLVMVGRAEARRVAGAADLPFADAVVPFPGEVEVRGRPCRLGWALARNGDGACRFHDGDRCTVYEARPWICRTYPVHARRRGARRLRVPGARRADLATPTPGPSRPTSSRRRAAEEDEAERVRRVLVSASLPADGTLVVDAEGVTRA